MADEASKGNNILSQIKEGQTKASEKQDKQMEVAKQAADAAVATKDANERIERLTEKVDERRKQKALDDKVAQAEQLEVLERLDIHSEEFGDEILSDLKKGITYDDEQLKAQYQYYEDLRKRESKDDKDKRLKEKAEEERLASNLRAEESLSGMLGFMGLAQDTADRMAKKAMQMKESVHKWWEDKKEKMASGAKSILEWLMKAAGLAAIWLIFKLLAKVDWEKLYNDMKVWVDLLWTGLTRFLAFKGIKAFVKWMKGTKYIRFITAAFRSVINVIKLVLGSGLRGLRAIFNVLTKGVFTEKGAIGKRIKSLLSWFKGGKGSLAAKIASMWATATQKVKAGLTMAKGWAKPITQWFGKDGKLVTKIKSMWQAVTGPVMKTLNPVINSLKTALKPLTAFFSTSKGATGAGGIFSKISALFAADGKLMTKVGKAMTFVKGIAKTFAKFFAPITVFMAAWAAISGGLDEAEKESGGFPQKILSFISGALKGLIDFFVFDLAKLIQDGIKWAIGWFMGLFGFSEEEIEKATDFDFVKPIRDAVMDAIDWVRDLFRFDGKGVDFSKLAKFIDILLWPLNQAIKWVRKLFGFEEKEGEEFSLGKLITDALNSIFKFFTDILNIDFKGLLKQIPGYDLISGLLGGPSKEDIQEDISELKKNSAFLEGKKGSATSIKENNKKIAALQAQLAKMATGGTILPGGAAIVGEGSMRGELVVNANSAAKVIPASMTADLMSGGGGGQNFAPTTIVNSAPTSSSTIMASSSLNPISQKYFRSD